jgi:hypothetical protein
MDRLLGREREELDRDHDKISLDCSEHLQHLDLEHPNLSNGGKNVQALL